MSYHFSKEFQGSYEEAIEAVVKELGKEGFGVLTEIDVKATLKKKLNVEFPKYKILGACHPEYAHKALSKENKIGTMLPCNVVVQEREGKVEVTAVNPVSSMMAVQNEDLGEIAKIIRQKLQTVIEKV